MNTQLEPQQADVAAWHATRLGRFTASDIGKLFTEPRTLTAQHVREYIYLLPDTKPTAKTFKAELREKIREAGIHLFGDTALGLIASKAGERLTGVSEYGASTRSMDRGTMLEHAARVLLSRYWKQIDQVTFQAYGDNAGATPDGLTDGGNATIDIKCPEAFGDVILFDQMIGDVCDFDALESWNKNYAWQIMMQAKCAGTKYGWLVYFTDRLPITKITDVERMEVQAILDYVGERMSEENMFPKTYTFASDGFHYAAKRFELTEERSKRIDQVLEAAEIECARFMALMS